MPGLFPRSEAQQERVFDRRVRRQVRRVWGRRLINVFLVVHMFALAIWLLPYQWPWVQRFLPEDGGGWIRTYVVLTGFQQTWQMFSPNPDTRDLDIEAIVTYHSGRTRSWRYPRMRSMGYEERYRRERMRKYLEIANYNQFLWASLARYAARTCNTDPHDPPVSVTLVRYLRDIPPPGQPLLPYKRKVFYRALVSPEDLR